MPGLLYADDLVLCGESEEYIRSMLEHFVEVCKKRGLEVNAGKSKGRMLGGKEVLKRKVCVDRMQLEHVSVFKYLGCVLDESGTDEAECCRKVVMNGRRVASALMSLVNAKGLQLEYATILHVLIYGNETMIWKKEERSRFRAVQIDNFKGLLGIGSIDKILNAQIRELCGMMKGG